MTPYIKILPVLLLAGLPLAMGGTASAGEIELDEAAVFIEWNFTDTDFGIQLFWDGEPWRSMRVISETSRKRTVLNVRVSGNLRLQGLTEGFFESAEPPADELSMEEFFERFPEGEYSFFGKSLEGDRLVGEAEFTHVLPQPPFNLLPAEGHVVSHDGFLASFEHNPDEDVDGEEIDIELYVIVVEKLDDEPILQVFEVILPPDQTSVFVPGEFLEPETEYKLEVIAQEESGNRTIAETGAFETTPEP